MIFGAYPCCGGNLHLECPDNSPQFAPEECPHCGAPVWHRLSRLDPKTWLQDDFFNLYEVDEASKTLKERNPQPPLSPAMQGLMDEMVKASVERMVDKLLSGDKTDSRGGLAALLK